MAKITKSFAIIVLIGVSVFFAITYYKTFLISEAETEEGVNTVFVGTSDSSMGDPSGMSCARGAVALHAYLFLCAQELEELHQAQPMGYLYHRHDHCCALQFGHLLRTHR